MKEIIDLTIAHKLRIDVCLALVKVATVRKQLAAVSQESGRTMKRLETVIKENAESKTFNQKVDHVWDTHLMKLLYAPFCENVKYLAASCDWENSDVINASIIGTEDKRLYINKALCPSFMAKYICDLTSLLKRKLDSNSRLVWNFKKLIEWLDSEKRTFGAYPHNIRPQFVQVLPCMNEYFIEKKNFDCFTYDENDNNKATIYLTENHMIVQSWRGVGRSNEIVSCKEISEVHLDPDENGQAFILRGVGWVCKYVAESQQARDDWLHTIQIMKLSINSRTERSKI